MLICNVSLLQGSTPDYTTALMIAASAKQPYCVGCVMFSLRLIVLTLLLSGPAFSAEPVGQAILINTSVTGNGGSLVTRSPVHRDERIRTSRTGLGEFVFRDGTKLAVGAGSSVVIDKFVFNDDDTAKAFAAGLSAAVAMANRSSNSWVSTLLVP